MARPTKLTPETQERILKAVRAGNYAEASARSAGVAASTYYRWLDRGAGKPDGPYRAFRDAVRCVKLKPKCTPLPSCAVR